MTDYFPVIAEIPYKEKLFNKFCSNKLYEDWYNRYPNLFDENDLQNTRSQAKNGYHFHEWLGAILLFQITGWFSLQQKYQFKKHLQKQNILVKLGANSLISFFENQKDKGFGSSQPPDLLVYSPDYSDWFMCEIKDPNDRLNEQQKEYFKELESVTNSQINLRKLKTM